MKEMRARISDSPHAAGGTLPWGWLLSVLSWLACLAAVATGQDTVYITKSGGPQGYTRLTGRVVDYTGRGLELETHGGIRTFPANQVLRIETPRNQHHVSADSDFAAGEFPSALTLYREARNQEGRSWVRRRIIAQIVWCYRALGRPEMAGEEFLVLIRDDPDTPHFSCIPLAWVPAQPSTLVQQAARRWIAKDDMPAAVLLGASHLLLTGDSHDAAMSHLAGLMDAKDPRIVQLVKAQMWRPMVAQAGERELAAWQATIERMPESLRAGPYYVLGRGWFQRQKWEQAALAFMRIPILYPEHRMMAARALMDAGWSLEKLDRTSQAARVYRELIQEYPDGPDAAQAQRRLEELASNGEP